MRILVITSGGDSPGMNAALRGVVRTALSKGAKVFVARNGYDGLMKGGELIHEFTWNDVGGILNIGGTILGTARSHEFVQPEGRKKAIFNLISRGINRLIVIGGDGSLTGTTKIYNEWGGVINEFLEKINSENEEPDWYIEHWKNNIKELSHCKIVGLVGSIDNDMANTSMTIGCDTALARICSAVDSISTTASSHQREFVVEVMGRNCGWLALQAAVTTGADWLFIPEYPFPSNWRSLLCNAILSGKAMGRRSSIVIVAEGARDEDQNPITSSDVKDALDRVGCDCRITILGHVQRGGSPSFYDRSMSLLLGSTAVEEVLSDRPSEPLIACVNGLFLPKLEKISDCLQKSADIITYYKEKKFQEAMEMRGNAFVRCYNATMTLMRANPSLNKIPHDCNIAVMHIGACSPGMNSTVRALVRLFDDKGYNIYAIFNGVQGFSDNNIKEFGWMNVNGWAPAGGAKLGTSRYQDGDVDFEVVQQRIIEYSLQAIVIIGGLDGYEFAQKLNQLKEKYPAFGSLKVMLIPCSISNNLPATQVTIGSDTALNAIIESVDKIKQSAMAHRRVFVIEVLGGQCGYLALLGALATGAEKAYIHEKEITLTSLQNDLDYLHSTFANQKGMALLMVSEKASRVFNTNFLATLFEEKSDRKFDVRVAILGHLQQGGNPSPLDRILSIEFAYYTVNRLDDLLRVKDSRGIFECVGYLADGELSHHSIDDALDLVDLKLRRPKDQWWLDTFYRLAETFAQYSEKI